MKRNHRNHPRGNYLPIGSRLTKIETQLEDINNNLNSPNKISKIIVIMFCLFGAGIFIYGSYLFIYNRAIGIIDAPILSLIIAVAVLLFGASIYIREAYRAIRRKNDEVYGTLITFILMAGGLYGTLSILRDILRLIGWVN